MVFQFVQKNEKPEYLVGGRWSLLTKACNEYKKAELVCDEKKMKKLAQKINLLQASLELTKTNFPMPPPKKNPKCLSLYKSRALSMDNELVKICKGLDIKNMPEYYTDNTPVEYGENIGETAKEPTSTTLI